MPNSDSEVRSPSPVLGPTGPAPSPAVSPAVSPSRSPVASPVTSPVAKSSFAKVASGPAPPPGTEIPLPAVPALQAADVPLVGPVYRYILPSPLTRISNYRERMAHFEARYNFLATSIISFFEKQNVQAFQEFSISKCLIPSAADPSKNLFGLQLVCSKQLQLVSSGLFVTPMAVSESRAIKPLGSHNHYVHTLLTSPSFPKLFSIKLPNFPVYLSPQETHAVLHHCSGLASLSLKSLVYEGFGHQRVVSVKVEVTSFYQQKLLSDWVAFAKRTGGFNLTQSFSVAVDCPELYTCPRCQGAGHLSCGALQDSPIRTHQLVAELYEEAVHLNSLLSKSSPSASSETLIASSTPELSDSDTITSARSEGELSDSSIDEHPSIAAPKPKAKRSPRPTPARKTKKPRVAPTEASTQPQPKPLPTSRPAPETQQAVPGPQPKAPEPGGLPLGGSPS